MAHKGNIPWNKGKNGFQVAWNKGLKLSTLPEFSAMGFQKGNNKWDNEKTRVTQFKQGANASPSTQFKKGCIPLHAFPKGEKPWNYIEDRSKVLTRGHPFTAEYIAWRTSVFQRDGYKCRMGQGDCGNYVEAHHILTYKDYPELRYQINNGITLCRSHHPRKREEVKRLEPIFKALVSVI